MPNLIVRHVFFKVSAIGRWPYNVLVFRKSNLPSEDDPAYDGVDAEAAMVFGPLTVARREDKFIAALREELQHWQQADRRDPNRDQRLEMIRRLKVPRR